jgi:UDPglucose 6-dehydrogenase
VGVLGLAFKGGTDDIRESPAVQIVCQLAKEGCEVAVYDPAAMERAASVLPPEVKLAGDAYAAASGADALLILTDWEEFRTLDLHKLREALRQPIVVDGRNLYSPEKVAAAGMQYFSVGRPIAYPKSAARAGAQGGE